MEKHVKKASSRESVFAATLRLKNMLEKSATDTFLCKVFLHANTALKNTMPLGSWDDGISQHVVAADSRASGFAPCDNRGLEPQYYAAKENFLARRQPSRQASSAGSKPVLRIV